jgi:hypothetical protein
MLACSLHGNSLELPSMISPEDVSRSHSGTRASHIHRTGSSSSRPQRGAAKFFKSLWEMCRSSYDVNHKALVLSQETRRCQNEHFRSRNIHTPEDGPEMTEVPYVNFEMPPIDDAMFFGLDPAAYGASSSAAQGEDDDEDEGEDEEEEEESPNGGDDEDEEPFF